MNLLKLFVRKSPGAFTFGVLCGVLGGIAGMGLIAEINSVLSVGPSGRALAIFIGLCVARLAFAIGSQTQFDILGQRTVYELRVDLSRSIVALPQRTIEQMGAPKLLAALSQDVLALARGGYMFGSVLTQAAFVIACAVYLGTMSLSGLALVAVVLVVGIAFARRMSAVSGKLWTRAREDEDVMFAGFRGITVGNKELKLHAKRRAQFVAQTLEEPSLGARGKRLKAEAVGYFAGQFQSLLFMMLVGLLLFEAPKMHILDTPLLRSYVFAVLYMQSAVQIVLQNYTHVQKADVALAKMKALGLSVSARPEVDAPPLTAAQGIELRGVVHAYKGEEGESFTLGPINQTIRAGEVLFIVGGNGSGKSTLVKLLTGLYAPEAGEIRVDGKALDDATRPAYRQLFSAVFSDWYLFDRLHGIDSASLKEDAARYLTELKLDQKVKLLPDGSFSTTALSQGQRKRLMMLTAYLEDRAVYVFDEWASDQDPIFKDFFYRRILKGLKDRGKMVIVVTHDDHYFSVADKVLRLEMGKSVSSRSIRPPALAS